MKFLKLTRTEGGDLYVRASEVQDVWEVNTKAEKFGFGHAADDGDTVTRLTLASTTGYHSVVESAADVVHEIERGGR